MNVQPASAATSEETYGGKAEDGLDDDDDGNTDEARAVAVSAAAAPSQQVFTNQNAGLDAAMQLLRLTQSLNGAATAADYKTLLEVRLDAINATCMSINASCMLQAHALPSRNGILVMCTILKLLKD